MVLSEAYAVQWRIRWAISEMVPQVGHVLSGALRILCKYDSVMAVLSLMRWMTDLYLGFLILMDRRGFGKGDVKCLYQEGVVACHVFSCAWNVASGIEYMLCGVGKSETMSGDECPCEAASSAFSLPLMPTWDGTYWR